MFLPLAFPSLYLHAIIGSGLLWSLAFAVFTITYWPILSRPRLDGDSRRHPLRQRHTARQVALGRIAGDDHMTVLTQPGQRHLDLSLGGVLGRARRLR